MADFAPPTGPPPPQVPEGWKAVWNDQYKEWFFVNIYTKKSQWDKPTSPVYPDGAGGGDMPPGGAPPGYDSSTAKPVGPEKGGYDLSEDEKLARKLQEEENARAHGGGAAGLPPSTDSRGAADAYYGSGGPPGYGQPSPNPGQYGAPQGQYGQQQYEQQPQYGQQQYGAPPQPQGMYGNPSGPVGGQEKKGLLGKLFGKKPQQGGGAMGSPYAQPGRKPGMPLGAAALGAGGGLLGGAMLASAIDGHHGGGGYGGGYGGGDDGNYGGDDGNYGGDDGNYGGDDGGGFGGDGGGGGDFGGGDFGGGD